MVTNRSEITPDALPIPFRLQFLAYRRNKLLSWLGLCDALKITCHLCNCGNKSTFNSNSKELKYSIHIITFCPVLMSTMYSLLCFRRRCCIILVVLFIPIKAAGFGGTQRVHLASRIPLLDRCSVGLKKCHTGLRLFFFDNVVPIASFPSPSPD